MDGNALPVSSDDLYARLGTAKAPVLIDVRRRDAFDADERLIIGAARRLPEDVSQWRKHCPTGVRSSLIACTVTKSAKVWLRLCEAQAWRRLTSKAASQAGRAQACRLAASATPPKTNG